MQESLGKTEINEENTRLARYAFDEK